MILPVCFVSILKSLDQIPSENERGETDKKKKKQKKRKENDDDCIAVFFLLLLLLKDSAHGHVPGHVNCNHLIVSIGF
jgi:hypothetical protein